MREIFRGIIGNSAVKEHIGKDIAEGTNSHAYIIEGGDGSGKRMIADAIASALACENRNSADKPLPCGECNNCRKISKGICSDVVYITSGDKASIGVDAIRELKSGLYVTPNDSDVRTYIIENAERMTPQAQNSLLLSLEEPPSFVVFLLLTEDASKLLETVRSRAQIIRTEVFSSEQVADYLSGTTDGQILKRRDPELFSAAVSLSGGALGKAAEYMKGSDGGSDVMRCRGIARDLVRLLCCGKAAQMLGAVSSSNIKNTADAKTVLILSANAVRDLIAVKRAPDSSLVFYATRDEALSVSSTASFTKLFTIHEKICEAAMRLDANASSKGALTDMVLQISRYRKK